MTVKHEAAPNWAGACEKCGGAFERYVRASKPLPRFCSQTCRINGVFGAPKSADHRSKLGKRKEDHHKWVGDAISERGGRARALRWFPAKPCEFCGGEPSERHHKDANTANNSPSNIQHLCRPCHMAEDGRLARIKDGLYVR